MKTFTSTAAREDSDRDEITIFHYASPHVGYARRFSDKLYPSLHRP